VGGWVGVGIGGGGGVGGGRGDEVGRGGRGGGSGRSGVGVVVDRAAGRGGEGGRIKWSKRTVSRYLSADLKSWHFTCKTFQFLFLEIKIIF